MYGIANLVENFGYEDVNEMLQECAYDSIVPAICTECGATYELEPDAANCRCEMCGKNKVQSALVLMMLI